ncbi:unnamed protein product [Brassica napus]|uniref:(rape) hypothetical protein n=1 Tax=Brassica napus TaxID=3708 RepID=A0A816L5H5_BRANA|nr:unnamed protein product [Brassica napus]
MLLLIESMKDLTSPILFLTIVFVLVITKRYEHVLVESLLPLHVSMEQGWLQWNKVGFNCRLMIIETT